MPVTKPTDKERFRQALVEHMATITTLALNASANARSLADDAHGEDPSVVESLGVLAEYLKAVSLRSGSIWRAMESEGFKVSAKSIRQLSTVLALQPGLGQRTDWPAATAVTEQGKKT